MMCKVQLVTWPAGFYLGQGDKYACTKKIAKV